MQGAVRLLMDLPELTGIDREISMAAILERAGGTAVPAYLAFAIERVRYALETRGASIHVARAATTASDVPPLRARRIADALEVMRASEDFQALAVLFKRVKNIAKELKVPGAPERGALTEPAERALLDELDARRPRIEAAMKRNDYRAALAEIAVFRLAVDRFFTEVFVMAEDARLRTARLALMAELRDLILTIADISEIVPQTE
jgi:glycyl-tRNA synthetase beta chain